jgi:hypothetical protein
MDYLMPLRDSMDGSLGWLPWELEREKGESPQKSSPTITKGGSFVNTSQSFAGVQEKNSLTIPSLYGYLPFVHVVHG